LFASQRCALLVKYPFVRSEDIKKKMPTQMVTATYTVQSYFKIPSGIDLNDKTQVASYGIKWDVLYISLTNGEELEIQPSCELDPEYKRPDEISVDKYNKDYFFDSDSD
jgi:hypothetical protein